MARVAFPFTQALAATVERYRAEQLVDGRGPRKVGIFLPLPRVRILLGSISSRATIPWRRSCLTTRRPGLRVSSERAGRMRLPT
eukprot:10174393-Lingulodinium_polyedra.AAC.1